MRLGPQPQPEFRCAHPFEASSCHSLHAFSRRCLASRFSAPLSSVMAPISHHPLAGIGMFLLAATARRAIGGRGARRRRTNRRAPVEVHAFVSPHRSRFVLSSWPLSGSSTCRAVPWPEGLSTVRVPPSASTRSVRPISPEPRHTASVSSSEPQFGRSRRRAWGAHTDIQPRRKWHVFARHDPSRRRSTHSSPVHCLTAPEARPISPPLRR